MNNKINEIKNSIYEAEGLLELLQNRPEKLDALRPLISSRLTAAAAGLASLSDGSPAAGEEEHARKIPEAKETATENETAPAMETGLKEETDDKKGAVKESITTAAGGADTAKPAFCLNDRFRFKRAIFGGDADAFNDAMDRLTTFDSFEEAEEYFYGNLDLDPEDEDVTDFMTIIRNYFGS